MNEQQALAAAAAWIQWYEGVVVGNAPTVYYLVAAPPDWTGSSRPEEHPYLGLRVKIGTSKHALKRVAELQTGTADKLILHALEPGGVNVERQRHQQFADHRGLG
jgi:Meiotically Up-regulated Gene 113 (MUG113) protein